MRDAPRPSSQADPVHPCPCCGFKTLPARGAYDLCPVCWWEDDGAQPWEYSGPNGRTLVEAQQEYLAVRRPYRLRPGKVRRPRRHEARDPRWRPHEMTPELMAQVQRTDEEQQRHWDEERHRVAQEIAADPEGPFQEYNAAMRALRSRARTMTHTEVKAQVRALGEEHHFVLPDAQLELQARLTKDRNFYRHHPVHAAWWLLRHGRPGTFRQRWRELRTGSFRVSG